MARIILASQSPRRKKLLEQIGLKFEVFPSNVDETSEQQNPFALVEELALLKAKHVAAKFSESIIIGADTIVVFKDQILGKPQDAKEASAMLNLLSGATHEVCTGVAIVKTDKNNQITHKHSFFEQTKVTFSTLDERDIKYYIQKGAPFDKAGSYGIQDDLGALFVEHISGDYYNIVGFPLNRFYREIKEIAPEVVKLISD
jgi:septum formation protein